MSSPYTVTLIEQTHTKIEGGVPMRYGVPIAHAPLDELARRLGITVTRLLAAFGKEPSCHLRDTATSRTA